MRGSPVITPSDCCSGTCQFHRAAGSRCLSLEKALCPSSLCLAECQRTGQAAVPSGPSPAEPGSCGLAQWGLLSAVSPILWACELPARSQGGSRQRRKLVAACWCPPVPVVPAAGPELLTLSNCLVVCLPMWGLLCLCSHICKWKSFLECGLLTTGSCS